jgi:hypothetical protein
MVYVLGEDDLRLRVKPVLFVILLNVIDDGDTCKHAPTYRLVLSIGETRFRVEPCGSGDPAKWPVFRLRRANGVEQSEAPENVEFRPGARTVFLGHALQYGQNN